MVGSERLFESGDSWFSAKTIKVVCHIDFLYFLIKLKNIKK